MEVESPPGGSVEIWERDDGLWVNSEGRAKRRPDRWEVRVRERGVEDGTPVSGSSNRKERADKERGRRAGGGVDGNQGSGFGFGGCETPV